LHTKTAVEDGNRVLIVEGRIGHVAADELEAVLSHTSDGVSTVVIDLSGVDYLSSAALKVIQSGADRLSKNGGQLRVRAPSGAARFALELSGLLELIE
jgi:anti-anti-sigma factor